MRQCYYDLRKKNNLPILRVPGVVLSRRVFATRRVLLVMTTLEDERYVVIKAYKCTVSEIWRDFFCISIYCVYVVSLHTESTDSVIGGYNQLYIGFIVHEECTKQYLPEGRSNYWLLCKCAINPMQPKGGVV